MNHKINPRTVEEEVVKVDSKTGEETIVTEKVVRYDSHGSYQVKFNEPIIEQETMANKDADGLDIDGTEKER